MAAALRHLAVLVVLFVVGMGPAFAEDAPAASPAAPVAPAPDAFRFSMSLGLGVQTFNEFDG
jgi:hypothetical protein